MSWRLFGERSSSSSICNDRMKVYTIGKEWSRYLPYSELVRLQWQEFPFSALGQLLRIGSTYILAAISSQSEMDTYLPTTLRSGH